MRLLVILNLILAGAANAHTHSMRLVESPFALGEGLPRATLLRDYERIDATRPGLTLPVAMVVGGVVGMGGGVASGIFGMIFSIVGSGDAAAGFLTLGVVLLVAGIGLVAFGISWIIETSADRAAADARLGELKQQLERADTVAPQPAFRLASF